MGSTHKPPCVTVNTVCTPHTSRTLMKGLSLCYFCVVHRQNLERLADRTQRCRTKTLSSKQHSVLNSRAIMELSNAIVSHCLKHPGGECQWVQRLGASGGRISLCLRSTPFPCPRRQGSKASFYLYHRRSDSLNGR